MDNEKSKNSIWSRSFVCMMFCNMCLGLSQYIVQPLVSSYAKFLGAGAVVVGLLTGLYYGVSLICRPFAGPAIVWINKKKVLIISFLIGIIANFMYATFNSIPIFVLARALHGVQFSFIGAIIITIAGDSLPRDRMGAGLGIYSIGGAAATAIGPAVGITLRNWGESRFGEVGGYKAMFYGAVVTSALALIPSILAQPKTRTKEELESAGAWYKNILAKASLPPSICNMFFSMAYSLFSAYMIPYALEKGFSGVPVFFTIYAVTLLISRPISGRLTDRFGPTVIIYPAAALLISAFILLWSANSIAVVYVSAVLAAMGYGGAHPAFQIMSLQSLPDVRRGVGSNTNYFGVDAGLFIGPALAGIVINHFLLSGTAYSIMYLCGIVPICIAVVLITISRKYIKSNLAKMAALRE